MKEPHAAPEARVADPCTIPSRSIKHLKISKLFFLNEWGFIWLTIFYLLLGIVAKKTLLVKSVLVR